jgi:hypothetical protein
MIENDNIGQKDSICDNKNYKRKIDICIIYSNF